MLAVEEGDVLAFSKLACKSKSRGKDVKVVVCEIPSDSIGSSSFASEGCGVAYIQVWDQRRGLPYCDWVFSLPITK
jgi:hypothetical protein